MKPNEAAFEEYVATWLVEHGGYDNLKGPGQARPPAFDPVTGIETEDLFEFIGAPRRTRGSGCFVAEDVIEDVGERAAGGSTVAGERVFGVALLADRSAGLVSV